MNDRELLELAAKAAGIKILRSRLDNPICADMLLVAVTDDGRAIGWNPLTDDGDALRLAVILDMSVETGGYMHYGPVIRVTSNWHTFNNLSGTHPVTRGDDPFLSARRAIVSAAAEIGKAMK